MAKKPTETVKPRGAKKPTVKPDTKQNIVLAMLRRAGGASVGSHIAYAVFFSGALKRRLKIDMVSQKDPKTGERRYFVAAL